MKLLRWSILAVVVALGGCQMAGPDEQAIRQMVQTFIASVDRGD
jgi:hypothetical protein